MARGFLALALLACLAVVSVQAHFDVHPLSRVHVQNIVDVRPSLLRSTGENGGVITIDAPILNGTGNTVTVSWSGMASKYPGNTDWIGVWSPKPKDYTVTAPAKWKFVTPDRNGAGSTTLFLLNMRASYVVVYFTNGMKNPQLLAESAPIEFSNYHIPMQIHLALTNFNTQMRVHWTSAQNQFPSLQWGLSPDNLSKTVMQVFTETYTAADMCGAPANGTGFHDPGFLHSAIIQGMPFNTKIYYQVGDESSGSKSDILSFYSPLHPNAREAEFIIFGDLGQVETDGSNEASQMDGSILTTRAIAKDLADGTIQLNKSAIILHIGDISYARGYDTLWDQFFYQLSPITPYIPWMTIDGNHERDFPGSGSMWTGQDSGGECGVALQRRFTMPDAGNTASSWWSLDVGPIHFIVMSTELDFTKGSAQWNFIAKDLASVDRSKTPFLILAGHRPMYIDSTNNSPNGGDLTVGAVLIEHIEPLLLQYQVDVAFWGHHHSAQRTCPVANFTCQDQSKAPVHIVTGAAGPGFSTNIQPVMPKYFEWVRDDTHGYTRGKVSPNAAELTLEFVNANDRTVMDSVTIKNKFPQTPASTDAADAKQQYHPTPAKPVTPPTPKAARHQRRQDKTTIAQA